VPSNPNPTVKQQRDERRAEKVAQLKKKQATEKRNKRIGIIVGSVIGAAALGLVVTFIVISATPKPDPDTITVAGVETWTLEAGVHVDAADGVDPANPPTVDYEADYGMNPPAGGNHWAGWLNCGIYTEPQQNERAVHALEHGAVWVTYDPDALSDEEITTLQDSVPSTYMIVSPYPGLPAPVVASAWGYQVQLDGVDDPRLESFISKYKENPDGPEYGAACTGAIDGPGKIA
jgi:hypothetical protein